MQPWGLFFLPFTSKGREDPRLIVLPTVEKILKIKTNCGRLLRELVPGNKSPWRPQSREMAMRVFAHGYVFQGVQFLTDAAEEIIERVQALQANGVPQSQKLRALKTLFIVMQEQGVPPHARGTIFLMGGVICIQKRIIDMPQHTWPSCCWKTS
ncbi:putative Midasin [Trypanosoma cruzi]|uniref:Putative Midasin n=1 Tax=Trypanosoma cruzi TaxID=5693 RepID=A0A2V2W0H9_TRYCR|nr:putative Midasin [Trypanosoma cruzi]